VTDAAFNAMIKSIIYVVCAVDRILYDSCDRGEKFAPVGEQIVLVGWHRGVSIGKISDKNNWKKTFC